ncbi:MAG: leucine-rich repeat protein, partial [Clostridiales bacterium]|nr:leucine-rich repeat protein [Clostridiales bacterium]
MRTAKCRLLSLTLAFLLCVGMIPLSFILAGAEEAAEETEEETATDLSDYIIANISFASADDLSGGGATATAVGEGMTYDDGESVTMTDGESYFTVAKDDGTALLEGLTEVTISFDANTTGDTSWAFEVTSETEHSYETEHYIGCVIRDDVQVERYNNTEGRPDYASGSTTNDTWVHYDCIFYADGCTAIYVDGELVSIVAQNDGFDLSLANCIGEDSTFYVGHSVWGEYFSGSLKNLVVYSTAIYEHTDDSTATDLSDYIIANISFASADDLSGGGATATAVGEGMTYDDGESVTMTDGESYFTVAKDDGTALLEGLTEVTISFDANTTGDTSWAFEVTSETEHSYETEHYIGCVIRDDVQVERYNNTEGRPDYASGSTTNDTWVHYDCIFYADGCTAIYVDGELVSIVAQNDGFDLSLANCIGEDSTFYVGHSVWGEFFSGSLKNLVVYSTAIYEHTDDSTEATAGYTMVSGAEVTVLSVIDDGNGTWDDNEDTTSDHVFDGDTSTYYDGAAEDAWVGCTFDSTVISTIAVYARSDTYDRVNGAEIQGSNDGETWTTLYTISEEENAAGQWIVCEITDTTAYTYVRIYGCEYGNVAEMKLYTAYGVTDGLVGYYSLTSDFSNSVEGGNDGTAIGYMFGDTEGDANFTDGSFHTTNGVNDGAVFTADITDNFTVSFTVSADWYVFAAPILWIGGTDQSSENWIGVWCDFEESYGPSVGSNDSEGYRIGVMGGTSEGVTYPVTDLVITLVVEDGVAYLYYDGVLVGQSNDPDNGAFQTSGANELEDLTTASVPNPWTAEDCAIYLGVNAWDESATAAYSDLYIYNRALTAEEVAEIATPVIYGSSCGDNLSWTLEDGTLTISGTGDMYSYEDGTTPWFYISNKITSIVIEDGVTSIGDWAFANCTNLTSVSIPDSVTSIGSFAFFGCSGLTSISISAYVTSIGGGTFANCTSLGEIVVDESNEAYCSADGILFDKGMTTLISYPAGKTETSYDIPDTVTAFDWGAFYGCASLESVTIPDGVADIRDWAFADCWNLSSVTIGSGLTSMGGGAFFNCVSLTSITIPGSVTYISGQTFCNCQSLGEITFEGDAPYIEDSAFEGVTATAYYPYGNDTWTEDVMQDYGGSITWLTVTAYGMCGDELSWTLTSDGTLTISGTGEMFDYSEDYGETAPWCDDANDITKIVIENGVTSIGDYAFYNCWCAESVVIPDSVMTIGQMAFEMCFALTSVTIPASVSEIGYMAFYNCSSLTEIIFEGDALSFGDYAFYGVTATAYYPASNDTWTEDVMQDYGGSITWVAYTDGVCGDNLTWMLTSDGTLTISGTGDMYDYEHIEEDEDNNYGTAPWFSYFDSITSAVIEDGVTSIGNFAFFGCYNMTEITVGSSVTSIGYFAFQSCGIESITLPDSLTTIYDSAFDNCTNLTSIVIPDSVTEMGSWVFGTCTSLTSVTLGSGITSIGEYTFYGCSSLESITIPDSVTWIGSYAFLDCTSLESITIPESVTDINGYAFQGCTSLTSVTIPASVTWFADGVFAGCTSLTEINVDENNTAYCSVDGVVFDANMTSLVAYPAGKTDTSYDVPDGVTTINVAAFDNCAYLESVTFPESLSWISNWAFDGHTGVTEITFNGDAPGIDSYAFYYITATVYYPAENDTWTEDVMQDYGGTITWEAYGAETTGTSGTCGDNLTWTLEDGTLTISGTGDMYDYDEGTAPWSEYSDSITSVVIEDGAESIGAYAFTGCTSLTSITIPDSVTSIGNSVFYGCTALSSVTIPDSVTYIGEGAFSCCTSLESIIIPAGVTVIAEGAFSCSYGLTEITFEGDAPSIGDYAFDYVTATAYYPASSSTWTEDVMQDYGGTITWVAYTESGTCGDNLTWMYTTDGTIIIRGTGDMYDYDEGTAPWYEYHESITSLVIPDGVTSIGWNAFVNCTSLESVTIPDSVTEI